MMNGSEKNLSGLTEMPATECDILVVGGGIAGCCAALQAARCGQRTVLLEKETVVGGNSSPNLGVEIRGAQWFNSFCQELGLVHELESQEAYEGAFSPITGGPKYNISNRRETVWRNALRAAGVDLRLSHFADGVTVSTREDGSRQVTEVSAIDTEEFRRCRFRVCGSVIDASGDGLVAAAAGADFLCGCESKAQFNERSAPEEPRHEVQGTSLTAVICRVDHPVEFIPPEGTEPYIPRTWDDSMFCYYHEFQAGDGLFRSFKSMRESEIGDLFFLYVTETGGNQDTIGSARDIHERLRKQLWSYWNYAKNGPTKEIAANWEILWVSPIAGKRESRRVIGEYILTQTDVESSRVFPDAIAFGGHNVDEHRMYGEYCSIYNHGTPPVYSIPFRSCCVKGFVNLLAAGRLISATHLAHASVRVMRTGGAVGQAVGLAAALCNQRNITPMELVEKHWGYMQKEMIRYDLSFFQVEPCFEDGDFAPEAQVSADTELRFNEEQNPSISVPRFKSCGNLLADWQDELHSVSLYLKNLRSEPVDDILEIFRYAPPHRWRSDDDRLIGELPLQYAYFRKLVSVPFVIPANFEGWLTIPLDKPLKLEPKRPMDNRDRLLVWLPKENPEIMWYLNDTASELSMAVELEKNKPQLLPYPSAGSMQITPPPRYGEAVSVTDGWSFRCGIAPLHRWSAAWKGEPVQISLDWNCEKTLCKAVIVFDDLEGEPDQNPWRCGKRVSPKLVRDYTLYGDGRELFRVTGNHKRVCSHCFEPQTIRKFTLEVTALNGEQPEFGVYRISCYGDIQ